LAEPGEDPVLHLVQRGKIRVAAFRLDDVVAAGAAEELCDAQAGAGSDDADYALLRQVPVGTEEVAEVLAIELRDRMADGAQVVDEEVALDAEFGGDRGGTDFPLIVRELDEVAFGWRRQCDCRSGREGTVEALRKCLPGLTKARMFGGPEGAGFAQ
jgi:hypothetical protein